MIQAMRRFAVTIEVGSFPRTLTLEEVDELFKRPVGQLEINRRRTLRARSDRLLRAMPPIPVPIEELIRREQEYNVD
jgi:hypothetical protein